MPVLPLVTASKDRSSFGEGKKCGRLSKRRSYSEDRHLCLSCLGEALSLIALELFFWGVISVAESLAIAAVLEL